MTLSVEALCETIEKLQLMSSRDSAAMKARWFRPERTERADVGKFCAWLRTNHFLSGFVVDLLRQGKADELLLNQYRVHDQLKSGPLAGAYLARDPLDRPVIVQIFSSSVMNHPAQAERIKKIVRELIALDNPYICRAIDEGTARGMYYVVREQYDAETLANVLSRRGKLAPEVAARIFALACEGLRVLHERHLPGGALTAECLLLTATGKGPRSQRSVRILIGAARRTIFDASALGRPDLESEGDIGLAPMEQPEQGKIEPTPADEIFRLGCVFYRALSGRDPFSPEQLPQPRHSALPLREIDPLLPEMLTQIVEQMIDPDPARRPKNASHIAKTLRVFLKTEEESRETHHEEQVVLSAPQPEPTDTLPETADEEEEAEEASPRPRLRSEAKAEGIAGKVQELWEEVQPTTREWMFLGVGALAVVVLILLVELLTGIRFVSVVCLATGAAITFFVERFIRWREERSEAA